MPEIVHREYEGGIPGKWVTTEIGAKLLAAIGQAFDEHSKTCQVCGADIDDGEQGCTNQEDH